MLYNVRLVVNFDDLFETMLRPSVIQKNLKVPVGDSWIDIVFKNENNALEFYQKLKYTNINRLYDDIKKYHTESLRTFHTIQYCKWKR